MPTGYTVDASGNTTQRGADTFSYDQANRLKSVGLVRAQVSLYTYDIAGGLPLLLDDGTRKYVWGLDPPDDIAAARRQVRDGGRLQ